AKAKIDFATHYTRIWPLNNNLVFDSTHGESENKCLEFEIDLKNEARKKLDGVYVQIWKELEDFNNFSQTKRFVLVSSERIGQNLKGSLPLKVNSRDTESQRNLYFGIRVEECPFLAEFEENEESGTFHYSLFNSFEKLNFEKVYEFILSQPRDYDIKLEILS
ncbi:MAG: hypothetical protein MHPSP_001577, partial [Paramarteilia canceri]